MAGIRPSAGSVGDRYDQTLAETINGLHKVEVDMLEWVEWFNRRRLLGPFGNIPPIEAGLPFFAATDQIGARRAYIQWPPANPTRFKKVDCRASTYRVACQKNSPRHVTIKLNSNPLDEHRDALTYPDAH